MRLLSSQNSKTKWWLNIVYFWTFLKLVVAVVKTNSSHSRSRNFPPWLDFDYSVWHQWSEFVPTLRFLTSQVGVVALCTAEVHYAQERGETHGDGSRLRGTWTSVNSCSLRCLNGSVKQHKSFDSFRRCSTAHSGPLYNLKNGNRTWMGQLRFCTVIVSSLTH